MSTIAVGVYKKLRFKKQVSQGTFATGGAATGKELARTTSTLDLKKATYQSQEIRPSQMRSDNRHGVRSVAGSINGELSPGTYQSFIESVLRAAATAAVTTGALTNVTAAVTVAPAGTFTRAAGSFVTDGFNVGDIVRWSGWTTTGVDNNAHNMMITALTPTVMTCYPLDNNAANPIDAKASGDSVTCVQAGKNVAVPQSGHTRDYYTVEHFFGDLGQSELFKDVVLTACNIKLPASGMATVEFPAMGLDMTPAGTAYFTSPAAASTTTKVASANGLLFVGGVKVGTITSFDCSINGNYSVPGGVVGSNIDPDVFPGVLEVSGNISILFDSVTTRDLFLNETESAIYAAFTTSNLPAADFVAIQLPRIKANGADKDDGEKGLTMTVPYVALENTAGGAGQNTRATVVSIQDSQFA